jgi:hypothetical protein
MIADLMNIALAYETNDFMIIFWSIRVFSFTSNNFFKLFHSLFLNNHSISNIMKIDR